MKHTDPTGHTLPRLPINNNGLLDAALREAVAAPFARRSLLREGMGAPWLEARAAMADDLYHAQGRLMEFIQHKLHISGLAAGLGTFLLDVGLAINQCNSTAEIAALFEQQTATQAPGPYCWLSEWAALHLDALHEADAKRATD